MTDPNELLMQIAWKRLWTPGTPYYLPTAILSGASGNGITVDPLGNLSISDTGAIPLVQSSTWGNISVELTNAAVAGISTLTNGGMAYDSTSGAFTATLGLTAGSFAGHYSASGTGVAGCAISTASTLLGNGADAAFVRDDDPAEDPNLALATSYRDQLALSDAGLEQVASYYNNNDTLNEVVSGQNGPNAFTAAWPNATPTGPGKTSAYYAQQTSTAAQNPNDPGATVGDTDYSVHSFCMQGILLKTLLAMSTQEGDRYDKAAQSTLTFRSEVQNQPPGPTTVGNVMTTLGATPPPEVASNTLGVEPLGATALAQPIDWDAVVQQADAYVEETYGHWDAMASQQHAEWTAALQASSTSIHGGFVDTFSVPSAKLSGTIQVVGVSPNTSLQITLTSFDVTVPRIAISLSGSGSFLDAVQNAIANANWFQDLMTKKVHDQLNSATLLTWLTDRVNQSITEALGAFGNA